MTRKEEKYSNSQNYRQYPSALNQPTQSRWLTHKSAFTFDHSISIGFISGLYGGRYRSSMPAAWYVLFVLAVQQLRSTLHCAAFCPFCSSPCDILCHFSPQLSRVTAILEVAIINIPIQNILWILGINNRARILASWQINFAIKFQATWFTTQCYIALFKWTYFKITMIRYVCLFLYIFV